MGKNVNLLTGCNSNYSLKWSGSSSSGKHKSLHWHKFPSSPFPLPFLWHGPSATTLALTKTIWFYFISTSHDWRQNLTKLQLCPAAQPLPRSPPLLLPLFCHTLCCQLDRGQQLVCFFLVALLFSNCWLTNLMWNSIWAYCTPTRLGRGGEVGCEGCGTFEKFSMALLWVFCRPGTRRSWAQSKNAHWQLNWHWKKPETKWKWAKVPERTVIADQ